MSRRRLSPIGDIMTDFGKISFLLLLELDTCSYMCKPISYKNLRILKYIKDVFTKRKINTLEGSIILNKNVHVNVYFILYDFEDKIYSKMTKRKILSFLIQIVLFLIIYCLLNIC